MNVRETTAMEPPASTAMSMFARGRDVQERNRWTSPRRRSVSGGAPGTPPKTPGRSSRVPSPSLPSPARSASCVRQASVCAGSVAGGGCAISAVASRSTGDCCGSPFVGFIDATRINRDIPGGRGGAAAADVERSLPPIPFSAAEAVTACVWKYAKAQAQRVSASPPSISPRRKRLRHCSDQTQQVVDAALLFPTTFGPSQPSQLSQDSNDVNEADAEAVVVAREILRSTLRKTMSHDGLVTPELLALVQNMALKAMCYWREVSFDLGKASASLARFLQHQRRLYWRKEPWRGVNIGGWLILEPGPSAALFEKYGPASCEWDLMVKMREQLGNEGAQVALEAHRETFVCEHDFRRIRDIGLNAVRIPFGYWTVIEPGTGEPYFGPSIEYLDRAVGWCKSLGLQVLLDLHGAPGGESAEKPCGRQQREWRWQDWRFEDSIKALRILAERYGGHPCVTGISVCNEPSEAVPAEVLCRYYDRAVTTIRDAGMRPDQVAVLLPVFRTERLDQIWRVWNRDFDGFARHANTAFDIHVYHCFGPFWQRQTLPQHLRMVRRHRKILQRVPAVVGEWSLALPEHARGNVGSSEEGHALCAFAEGQLEAYNQASHGWFFWNWRDCPKQHAAWDFFGCIDRRWLSKSQLAKASSMPVTKRAPPSTMGE
eukprot:TRINITY_DN43596_c0_g1_i1.p1 TRINITY_DN43596_c0_g1~~TRINITY_DN43596_c0_g1_i1.p1  ORF type:complete len:658 (-),score=102.89 TRINITY_DN43596_c0_g1_i1:173-2146(-)